MLSRRVGEVTGLTRPTNAEPSGALHPGPPREVFGRIWVITGAITNGGIENRSQGYANRAIPRAKLD